MSATTGRWNTVGIAWRLMQSGENISRERVKDLSVIWDDDHTNEINLNLNLNESSDPIGDESDDDVMMRSLSDCGNSRITEYQRLTTYGFDPLHNPSDV